MRPCRTVLAAVFLVAALLPPRAATAGTQELVISLDRRVKTFPGNAGLWIGDPYASQPLYVLNADAPVVTASLYKLALLLEVERRVEAGTLSYRDTITIEDEDVTDDGSYELPGTTMTVDAALEAMITYSDNGTALAFWHTLGPANVNATLVAQKVNDFHVAQDDVEDNIASPRAIGTFFTLLARKELVSAAASERMIERLQRQRINDRLPDQLPPGTVVAHKTGNLNGLAHDAGIISTKFGPRVVVAMTWDAATDEANEFIADVGSLVYAAVLEPPANAGYLLPTAIAGDVGTTIDVPVTVTNEGLRAWAASGADSFGLVWELRDAQQRIVGRSAQPQPLGAAEPGRSLDTTLRVVVPDAVGDYTATLGLADANGRTLGALGAATESLPLRAHSPFLANAVVQLPRLLHRREASLLIVQYAPLPAAGSVPHELALGYRFIDPRNGGEVALGRARLGTLLPGQSGTFFAPFVAPAIAGTYRLEYELTEQGGAVGQAASVTVRIGRRRIYPGDESRIAPRPSTRRARPSAAPAPKRPGTTPPVPQGRSPIPSPRP